MQDFISEDDLTTFEGFLRYHDVDATAATPEELEMWRHIFDDARARVAASPKVGRMTFQLVPGEHRYAVAVCEGSDLWLVLWVRRSRKGEFFVMVPRADREWDVHASYHRDGTLQMKSYGRRVLAKKCQPLTGVFRGNQPLAAFGGYGAKSVGAVCDRSDFSGVVEVAPGVLGPRDGQITVDLVEPGCDPPSFPWTNITNQEVFHDTIPWVVITVGSLG